MKEPIVLVGAGGHAASCIDVIEEHGKYEITGLVASREELGNVVLGYEVMATDADLHSVFTQVSTALVAVGQIRSPAPRMRLYAELQEIGFHTPSIVSPFAHVSRHAEIGSGTIVMHHAIVNANASVGCNCIINSRALIEHDAVVGQHCHVSTSATINGAVRIGDGCFLGSGSVVREGVTLAENSFVPMGERVIADPG